MCKDLISPLLVMIGGAILFAALLILGTDYSRSKTVKRQVERHKAFQATAAAKDCKLNTQVFAKITSDGHQYNRYEVYDCDGARLIWDQRRGKKADSGPDIGLVVTSGDTSALLSHLSVVSRK